VKSFGLEKLGISVLTATDWMVFVSVGGGLLVEITGEKSRSLKSEEAETEIWRAAKPLRRPTI
jgi:hypothetical protein